MRKDREIIVKSILVIVRVMMKMTGEMKMTRHRTGNKRLLFANIQ